MKEPNQSVIAQQAAALEKIKFLTVAVIGEGRAGEAEKQMFDRLTDAYHQAAKAAIGASRLNVSWGQLRLLQIGALKALLTELERS